MALISYRHEICIYLKFVYMLSEELFSPIMDRSNNKTVCIGKCMKTIAVMYISQESKIDKSGNTKRPISRFHHIMLPEAVQVKYSWARCETLIT